MRANLDRSGRLDFDQFAELYDCGRPKIPQAVVGQAAEAMGLEPGAEVLEVGCGSGQLTEGLLTAGMKVTGLEFGRNFQRILARRYEANDNFRLICADFEEAPVADRFDAVVSANAFHWFDPAVSYRKASSVLKEKGCLWLVWNLPILPAALQDQLNSLFTQHFIGVEWDTRGFLGALPDSVLDGRREVAAGGQFDDPWWDFQDVNCDQTAAAFARHVASYHSVAQAIPGPRRGEFIARIEHELISTGFTMVSYSNLYYSCYARRTEA